VLHILTRLLPDLAVIFRPGLISHPTHEMEPKEHQLSQSVLEFLIEHQDWFMLDIPPPPPPREINTGRGGERQNSYGSVEGEGSRGEDNRAGRDSDLALGSSSKQEHPDGRPPPHRRHTAEENRTRGRARSPSEVIKEHDLIVHALPQTEGGWRLVERTRSRERDRDPDRDHERRRHTRRPSTASALSDGEGMLSGLESGEVSPLSASGHGYRNGGNLYHTHPPHNDRRDSQQRMRSGDAGAVTVARSRTLPTGTMRRNAAAAAKDRTLPEDEKKSSSPTSPNLSRQPPNVLKKQKRASMQPQRSAPNVHSVSAAS
jgi:hypothetical protein